VVAGEAEAATAKKSVFFFLYSFLSFLPSPLFENVSRQNMLLYSNVLYTNKSPHDRLLKEFKTDWMNWRRNQFLRATREHQFWFLFSLQRGFLMGRISYGNGGSLQFTEAVLFWLHCSSSFDSRLFREEAKAYRVVFG